MNRDELAKLIDDQFSAHVFDCSFTAKPAMLDALWPVLAQVWEDGFSEGQNYSAEMDTWMHGPEPTGAPNPYGEVPA